MFNLKSAKGQSVVEYGLLIAAIAVVAIVILTPVGPALSDIFINVASYIRQFVPAGA